MVKLTKIYTKSGDQGTTVLGSGARVNKDDLRVEAYGTVDELNAVLGVAVASAASGEAQTARLVRIQNELFDLGADLCVPVTAGEQADAALRVTKAQVGRLEDEIDELNNGLGELRSFVLPGGSVLATHLHLARTVCRRAERRVTTLLREDPEGTSGLALVYLNRLSDLLFVMARRVNHDTGAGDELWVPGAGRDG